MKPKRFEIAVMAITLVFAAFTAGYFTGRGSVDSVVTIGVQSGTGAAAAASAGETAPGESAAPAGNAAGDAEPAGETESGESAAPAGSTAAGDAEPAGETELGESEAPSGSTGAETAEKLNLNTADAQQLTQLPGIGEVLAQRIVDYREKNGGFRAVEELLNVSGIGEKKYEAIKDLVEIG